jgi:altronate hydrolase
MVSAVEKILGELLIMQKIQKLAIIHESDNIAVALEDVSRGEEFPALSITALDAIPNGHKISLADIRKGESIIKYGYPIGYAEINIEKGRHADVHNIKTNLEGIIDYSYQPVIQSGVKTAHDRNFMGYLRENGDAGVRNEIWVIPTVGCINQTTERIAKLAEEKFAGKTDGVFAFPHPHGCSQMGDDQVLTQKILAGLANNNPNAAGVLILGLGCENNQIEFFKPFLGGYNQDRIKFLIMQESGDEVEESIALISELVEYAQTFKRQKLPASKLKIGLNCGGSDGFSGITANPLAGRFSDKLIDCGGLAVLTEVPEMFGAETILMNRCKNAELFDETVAMINNFKNYFIRYGQTIYENPSPGNKQGGISTLEEKSLGCIQKGGTREVTAVLDYGQKASAPGLNLMNGPGNDIVSNTSLVASGAQIILFTTGRGTPIGAPVPTVKISSNSGLYNRKPNWIDIDAGALLKDTAIEQFDDTFFDYILSVASGETKTKNEINGYREIAVFKDGVTL